MKDDTKNEMRRQIFYDPPTIEEALKNFMSWFVAEQQVVHKSNHCSPQEVLRMTRLLSRCINSHICSSDHAKNPSAFVASIWNPLQQDTNRKVTQTLGRVALQAVWHQLDTSSLHDDDDTEQEDSIVKSFLSSFEDTLFASLEQDQNARLIWNTDRGKDELMRRAVQRQAEATRRSGEANNEAATAELPRIEEINEANDDEANQG